MQIQINTDHNIDGHESLNTHVRTVVENALSHFSSHITRVEIHVTDETSHKTTENDKRCVMEARLEGKTPIAVTENADSIHVAVAGAAEKLAHLVGHTIGRMKHERNQRTDPELPGTADADQA